MGRWDVGTFYKSQGIMRIIKRVLEYRESVVADDSRPEMTLDEINEEIRLAREERAAREKAASKDSPHQFLL